MLIVFPFMIKVVEVHLNFYSRRRAYSDSEFVVVNTLAKWKKLEPNESDYSQGFSQKVVSRSCSVLFAS